MSASGECLAQLLQQWRNARFPQFQEQLQATASATASKQEEAEGGRRRLIDQCRAFKQTAADDVRKSVAPLMKSFQSEIDSLTGRARTAETSLLQLFDQFAALPDPSVALQEAATKCQRLADCELEAANLRRTLAQYNTEFAEVKNQEVTVRKLKDKLAQYDTDMQQQVDERSTAREALVREMYETRETDLQSTVNELAAKAKEAERRADSVQQALEGAHRELFSLRSQQDDVTDAKGEQHELMNTELERANQEAAERQVTSLQQQLERQSALEHSAALVDDGDGLAENPLLEAELRAKDKHISQLLDEVKQSSVKLVTAESERRQQESDSATQLTQLHETMAQLQTVQHAQHDYAHIKRELSVLKSIECGDSTETESGSVEGERPLEQMLLQKNRMLQCENASLRQGANKEMANGNVDMDSEEDDEPDSRDKLQTVLQSVECLIGAELVAGYHQALAARRPRKHTLHTHHSGSASGSGPPPAKSLRQDTLTAHVIQQSTPGTPKHALRHIEPRQQVMVLKATDLQANQVLSPQLNRQATDTNENNGISTLLQQNTTPVSKLHSKYSMKDGSVKRERHESMSEDDQLVNMELQQRLTTGINTHMHDTDVMNTTLTAATCKTLLAVHNLGQRLFARKLLGQSQGSLSELLAKPRSWERLTDKGRDSFRRIHAWLHDERAIELMSKLSKKNRQRHDDSAMLNTSALLNTSVQENIMHESTPNTSSHNHHSNDNHSQANIKTEVLDESPMMPSMSHHSNGHHNPLMTVASPPPSNQQSSAQTRWRHDDIPREKIIEIYQRELSKVQEDTSVQRKAVKRRAEAEGNRLEHAMPQLVRCNGVLPESADVTSTSSPSPRSQAADSRKSTLSDVTQQDYERHSDIDTDILVGHIRDFLLAESISQRLFGEMVLGLSQGSVSDMLARPRSWASLTQKGREPFVRMRLFLRDPSAVEKLRLQRAYELRPFSDADDTNAVNVPATQLLNGNGGCDQLSQRILANAAARKQQHALVHPKVENTASLSALPCPTDDSELLEGVLDTDTELDTLLIAANVRDQLQLHGIGQKIFGESIMGVSQGTVSDLLSKAKHWSQLSQRGREPYVRMQAWLHNPDKLEMLVRAAARRTQAQIQLQAQAEQSPPAKKIQRTLVTDEQKRAMRFAYAHDPYPTVTMVDFLGAQLGLSSRTVTNWFYNQRCRSKLDAASLSRALDDDLMHLYPALHNVFTLQQPLPMTDNSHNNGAQANANNTDCALSRVLQLGDGNSMTGGMMAMVGHNNDTSDDRHNVQMDEDCTNDVLQLSALFGNPLLDALSDPPSRLLNQPTRSPPPSHGPVGSASKVNLLDKALAKIKMRAQQSTAV